MDVQDGLLTIRLPSTRIKVGVCVDQLIGYLNGDYDMSRPVELMRLGRTPMKATSSTVAMTGTFEAYGVTHRVTIEVSIPGYNSCGYYCEFDSSYVASIS